MPEQSNVQQGPEDWGPSDWGSGTAAETVQRLHRWSIHDAEASIQWYSTKRTSYGRWSKRVRFLAIVLSAAGALCPLLAAANLIQDPLQEGTLNAWGYVFIALGVSVLAYDRYFGLSSGWIRLMLTQTAIERALRALEYDWAILSLQGGATPQSEHLLLMLQRLKDFNNTVRQLVDDETRAWVVEFQHNLAEMEAKLQVELEASRPGSLRVVVTNGDFFEEVSIAIDAVTVNSLKKTSECMLSPIAPGSHSVTGFALKDGVPYRGSATVDVQPGAPVTAEITLRPVPPIQEVPPLAGVEGAPAGGVASASLG